MALTDPVPVYNAKTNSEALMLKVMLEELGIEAFAAEDFSPVGLWGFGTLPEIHKPQVWVSRSDIQRAQLVLDHYEEQTALANQATVDAAQSGQPIAVVCDECGHQTTFPAQHNGTIQDCPHCGAFVDVGQFEDEGMDWQAGEEE